MSQVTEEISTVSNGLSTIEGLLYILHSYGRQQEDSHLIYLTDKIVAQLELAEEAYDDEQRASTEAPEG